MLAYVDEAGFAAVHPNRSAWTPKGERHLIEAKRDKRLNVLAALLSSGGLFSATLWQTMTSELFVGFLGLLNEHVAKPLTVILDNASIYTAKSLRPFVQLLPSKASASTLCPPTAPNSTTSNASGTLKYTWMA